MHDNKCEQNLVVENAITVVVNRLLYISKKYLACSSLQAFFLI